MPSTNEAILSGSRSLPARRRSSVVPHAHEPRQRHEDHLLHEVVRRVRVAQVAQAVEAHARREPAVELGFGGGIDPLARRRDAARELGVFQSFQGHARSITVLSWGCVTPGRFVTPPGAIQLLPKGASP
jgi:hypothetical protein